MFSYHTGDDNEGRVIGGVEVEPKFKYPFLVRIWYHNLPGGKNRSACTGSVLNRNWILTAAHCVTAYGYNQYYTVGDHDTRVKEENEQDLLPKEILAHENWR